MVITSYTMSKTDRSCQEHVQQINRINYRDTS